MEPGTFDHLNEGAATRLDLSANQTQKLRSVLIELVFDDKRGGLLGFSALFQKKGLYNLPGSGIGNAQNESISPEQVESVFGAPLLAAIAERMGSDKSLTAVAISSLLPALINEFAVGGEAPAGIRDTLKPAVFSAQDWLGEMGAFERGASATAADVAGSGADATTHRLKKSGGGMGRLLPLLLLCVALAGTFLLFKG